MRPICTVLSLFAVSLIAAGCGREPEIRRYRVPDVAEIQVTTAAPTHRTLAAMVPRGERVWFFKLTGPLEQVAALQSDFRTLVRSVSFAEGQQPKWSLPNGWQTEPGSGIRFATVQHVETGAELSVMPLPASGAGELENVNRWRGQLGLRPIPAEQLEDQVERESLGESSLTFVDIEGVADASKGMAGAPFAPFAGRKPQPPPPLNDSGTATPSVTERSTSSSELSYTVPEGWIEGKASGMRRAAFTISSGSESAELTVIALTLNSGSLEANVNRWRGQIGLGDLSPEEVEQAVQPMAVADLQGLYVEMFGSGDEPRGTLAVIVERDALRWFIKLTGDVELVRQQRAALEAFVGSLKLP